MLYSTKCPQPAHAVYKVFGRVFKLFGSHVRKLTNKDILRIVFMAGRLGSST